MAGGEDEKMRLTDYFHAAATGPSQRRRRLTPLGLLVFGGSLAIVVVGGLWTDRWLELPQLVPGVFGVIAGSLCGVSGGLLCGWCVLRFFRAHGTPVPMNPPDELVVSGAYAWVRNPMLLGVFMALLGLGLLLHSVGTCIIWTPAYALLHAAELKWVEEPELIRRFGAAYEQYRAGVPMFIPRPRRRSARSRLRRQ